MTESLNAIIHELLGGNALAEEELRQSLSGGVRWYLKRNLGVSPAKGIVDEVLDVVIEGVGSRRIQTTADLMTMTRTAAQQIASHSPREPRPKNRRPDRLSVARLKQVLKEYPARQREALTRYYDGEHLEAVCQELGISAADFHLLTSQARARYAELGMAAEAPNHSPFRARTHTA